MFRFYLLLTISLAFTFPPPTSAQSKNSNPPNRSLDYAGQLAAELEPDRKIVYKKINGRELELHVFLPEGWKPTDNRPCFHIIHGGGWGGMEPRRMYPFADYFTRTHGLVSVCVQYRLYKSDQSATVFDCVKDSRSSVRYVRSHASELGIDPDKLIVSGASAGGHLAAATALFDSVNEEEDDLEISCLPDALVLLFPVIDTSPEGYGQKKIGERWKELSPVDHVRSGLPPTITFHGTGDTVTPFAGAKRFHEEMQAAGNTSELVPQEGGAHGYLMRTKEPFDESMEKASSFLKRLGFFP